jgi:hypothetical protein
MAPEGEFTDYAEDGTDLTLIRWMLSLTPAERLKALQDHVNATLRIRELNARKRLPANSTDAGESPR